MPASTSSTGVHAAVGTPAAAMTSLANAFEPSRRAAAREGPKTARPRVWSSSVEARDERGLGADDDEVDVLVLGEVRERGDVVDADVEGRGVRGDPGVAGRGEHLGRLRRALQRPDDRVLAPSGADDEDAHLERAMKSSIGIATSVSYFDVPREPSSSDTRAIVLSSGASTTLMKSNCPSVAHCAFTLAPSCSTSLLTSRMRCGIVLDRLDALGGERREHDVGRHRASWLRPVGQSRPVLSHSARRR